MATVTVSQEVAEIGRKTANPVLTVSQIVIEIGYKLKKYGPRAQWV